eukprot:8412-Rhodomonas_salina.1
MRHNQLISGKRAEMRLEVSLFLAKSACLGLRGVPAEPVSVEPPLGWLALQAGRPLRPRRCRSVSPLSLPLSLPVCVS